MAEYGLLIAGVVVTALVVVLVLLARIRSRPPAGREQSLDAARGATRRIRARSPSGHGGTTHAGGHDGTGHAGFDWGGDGGGGGGGD